jgi:5'-nucleotidase (lipoprotein e(P4) family)
MNRKFLLAVVLLAACNTPRQTTSTTETKTVPLVVDGKFFTTVYQQQAAEYRALCLQAYNIGRMRVDEAVQQKSSLPPAIITDIDETVLDNSKYQGRQSLQGKDYQLTEWFEWSASAQGDTVPGAPSFLKYAASKGIEVYYITNREEKERVGTLNNLLKFNLPNADNAHLMLKQNSSSKEERRKSVAATHNVILLLGDNLADLSAMFDKKSTLERQQSTDILASDFGKRFIVLPNPVYGDWEQALYQYKRLTPVQKDSVLKTTIKGY